VARSVTLPRSGDNPGRSVEDLVRSVISGVKVS
jgi:hypothetical protein